MLIQEPFKKSNLMVDTNSQVCTILQKSKERILEFYKGTAKEVSKL